MGERRECTLNLIWVMIGGGIGAGLRYALSLGIQQNTATEFPIGTLIANLVGCLAIGLLSALFTQTWDVPEYIRLGVVVGVLGGFTTFSSFGLETIALIQDGRLGAAALYVLLSNLGGILGVVLGLNLAK